MLRGMSAMGGVITEHKKNNANQFLPWRFQLENGETGVYLFIGTPETEPAYVYEHTVRNGKRFDTIIHRLKECVACYVNTNGNRSVSKHSPKACYSMFDLRWRKKVKDVERSEKEGQDRFNYITIDEEEVTEKGKSRGIHARGGARHWKMPAQWFQALGTLNATSGKQCKSCLRGKITCIGYARKDGTKISVANLSQSAIRKKVEAGKLVERLKCSRCDNPVRVSIFNSPVQITRTGTDKNTTYQFAILPGEEIPEDVVELLESKDGPKPVDWEDACAEPSTEAQAQKLGVRNPFNKHSTETDDYDDDEEDEDDPFGKDEEDLDDDESDEEEEDDSVDEEDEDEDEDEDERPVKKGKLFSKKVVKKKLFKKPLKKKSVMSSSGKKVTKLRKVAGGRR